MGDYRVVTEFTWTQLYTYLEQIKNTFVPLPPLIESVKQEPDSKYGIEFTTVNGNHYRIRKLADGGFTLEEQRWTHLF